MTAGVRQAWGGLEEGHARPQTTVPAQRDKRPNRSTEPIVCQTPCCLISPIASDCIACEQRDAATKRSDPRPDRRYCRPNLYPGVPRSPGPSSPERRIIAHRVTKRQSAEQMQRLQHGASGNCPLGDAEKLQPRQSFESNKPYLIEDKAAHSCSEDLWKDPIAHSLKVIEVTEDTSVPRHAELEALPVSTAGNTDVWVMNTALVKAIDAGISKSGGLKLLVRGPGSTGYRIEAVSVEQLQDVQHPLECSGSAQHEDADRNPDNPSYKKQRHVWTSEAHNEFSNIVEGLGNRAVPTRILELMHVTGLTRDQVASHLQKYRVHAKALTQKASHKDALVQASQLLGEASMEAMLCKLGDVGLQALLAASGMANWSYTAPRTKDLACTEQAQMWTAWAKPDAGSTSFLPTLPSECLSQPTPRLEDRHFLPGQGSLTDSINTHAHQSAESTQPSPCMQPESMQTDLAEITRILDQGSGRPEWIDSMENQGLDNFLKSFTQP